MDFEDIEELDRYEYSQKCPCCGLDHKILTQGNNSPEYQTNIYLRCQCGEYIEFILPVN